MNTLRNITTKGFAHNARIATTLLKVITLKGYARNERSSPTITTLGVLVFVEAFKNGTPLWF